MSRTEVCADWITVEQLGEVCDASEDVTVLAAAIKMASDVLWNFTGRRWSGIGTDTVRPCMQNCAWPGIWTPLGVYNPAFGMAGMLDPMRNPPPRPSCGCGWISEFVFPARNVVDVTKVMLDGSLLDPSLYRLDDADEIPKLVRLGGHWWPSCQNVLRDDTEHGTWSIEYRWGQAPPIGGENACKSLSCQLALATKPEAVRDGRCRLPKRVTSVTRQGIALALIDPLTLFQDGMTGISEVDLWIGSIRYGDNHQAAQVIDPMRTRRVRRTG